MLTKCQDPTEQTITLKAVAEIGIFTAADDEQVQKAYPEFLDLVFRVGGGNFRRSVVPEYLPTAIRCSQ